MAIILVGNKCDLEDQRKIYMEDAVEFAGNRGLPLKEVSAKTGEGVEETLNMLVDRIIDISYEDMQQRKEQEELMVGSEEKPVKIDKRSVLEAQKKDRPKKSCKC